MKKTRGSTTSAKTMAVARRPAGQSFHSGGIGDAVLGEIWTAVTHGGRQHSIGQKQAPNISLGCGRVVRDSLFFPGCLGNAKPKGVLQNRKYLRRIHLTDFSELCANWRILQILPLAPKFHVVRQFPGRSLVNTWPACVTRP